MPPNSHETIFEFGPPPLPRSKPVRTYGKSPNIKSTSSASSSTSFQSPTKLPEFASRKAMAPFKSPVKSSSSARTSPPTSNGTAKSPGGQLVSPFKNMRTSSSITGSPVPPPNGSSRSNRVKRTLEGHGSSDFERSLEEDEDDDDDDQRVVEESTQRTSEEEEEEIEDSQPEVGRAEEAEKSRVGGGMKSFPSGLSEPMDIEYPPDSDPIAGGEGGEEIDEIFRDGEGSRRSSAGSHGSRKRASRGGQGGSPEKRRSREGTATVSGHVGASSRSTPGNQENGLAQSDGDEDGEQEVEEDDEDDDTDMQVEVESKIVIHVEAKLKPHLTHMLHIVLGNLKDWFNCEFPVSVETKKLVTGWEDVLVLRQNLERVWIAESDPDMGQVQMENAEFAIHLYKSSENDEVEEFAGLDDDEDQEQNVPAATVRELPSSMFEGLWDNLIYADNLKARLLNYISSTIAFSEAEIDFNVVSWNRLVLLHGPPGTGKTSLCRGLAQKLSIRLRDTYPETEIVEINSHSLFSKWFSESGKLVQKLFSTVTDKVNDPTRFVVVMIDEVESLTAARAGAASGTEPSDALRVVNALLTQLDKLKTRKNVLVMTTSNIAGAIDSAFVDRADIKEYVDFPPPEAVYWILRGCLEELQEKKMCDKVKMEDWNQFPFVTHRENARRKAGEKGLEVVGDNKRRERADKISLRVGKLAEACHRNQFAGRFLRRLPVLAHSKCLSASRKTRHTIEEWVKAMEEVVEREERDKGRIEHAIGSKAPPKAE